MLLTLLLTVPLAQAPPRPQVDPRVQAAPRAQAGTIPLDSSALVVRTGQGVQAPTQPRERSSSTVTTTPRQTPSPGRGADGRVMVRIRDMARVRGQEDNLVQGVGLVTGLSGTGDTAAAAQRNLASLLLTQNINVQLQDINAANVAVVWVEGTLKPGVKPGTRIDLRVSSIYDCESLVGGTLVQTELMDMTGSMVYVTGGGSISTGAFSAVGESATAVRNHLTVGVVPMGGKVEREVPTELVSEHGWAYLDLDPIKASFGNSARIAESINTLYPGAATSRDPMTVAIRVPDDLPESEYVAYLDSVLRREIEPESHARVVINERTGVIVIGEGVRITRGALTKGNLTVTIAESPEVAQPGPFSDGLSERVPRSDVLIEEEDRALTIINGAVTLNEVVEVLNVLGVTPRDMIQILQSMSQNGMLHAEIIVQ